MPRISHEISDTILHEILPSKATKSQRRKLQIVEAAIQIYADKGAEELSFEAIAALCKVSRPLIQHYFKDKDELFYFVAHYIRANSQDFVVRQITQQSDAKAQLASYIDASFEWTQKFPEHAKVWILFFYYCGIREKYRQANNELSSMAQDRIANIIKNGVAEKLFKCPDPLRAAKMIQSLLSGALLIRMTEKSADSPEKTQKEIKKYAFEIAGLK